MPPSSQQSRRWVFTINNPTDPCRENVATLGTHELIRYLICGRELGSHGTPHLQGFLICNRATRRSRIAGLLPRAHLEVARGTSQQASTYCKKENDFDEYGTLPEGNTSNKYIEELTAWGDTFIEDNGRAPTSPEIARAHPTAYLRYPRICRLFNARAPVPNLRSGTPREWQASLESELDSDADDRSIMFYVDPEGGKGKSWFQAWYLTKHPETTQVLSGGKRDDIAHSIDQSKSVFFFNIPRGGMEFLQYTILEQLKDQMVFSPKYNSQMKFLSKTPHVLVFCNEQPDLNKMTEDRYTIRTNYS